MCNGGVMSIRSTTILDDYNTEFIAKSISWMCKGASNIRKFSVKWILHYLYGGQKSFIQ